MLTLLAVVTKDKNDSNKLLLNSVFPSKYSINYNCNDSNDTKKKNADQHKSNVIDKNQREANEVSGDEVTQNVFELMMKNVKNKLSSFSYLVPPVIQSTSKEIDGNRNKNDKMSDMNIKNESGGKGENKNEDENLPPPLSSLPLFEQKEWRENLLNRVCSTLPDLYK